MATKPTSLSSFDFAQVVGEAHSVIRVRNLQCTASVGTDAWGRPNAIQPVLISATVVLKNEFASAAACDQVNNSTVHYGILSKALLKGAQEFPSATHEHTLHYFASWLHESLLSSRFKCHELVFSKNVAEQVLDISIAKAVEITVRLPKASLLGAGVSYTSAYADFTDEISSTGIGCRSKRTSLKIHDLDIPTLVGVNDIERSAKQRVVVNVEIDLFTFTGDSSNTYTALERQVVKTFGESSSETLEALAEYLNQRIMYYYIFPTNMGIGQDGSYSAQASELLQKNPRFPEWQKVKVSLEKPTAVTFADAPVIETIRSSAPTANKANMNLWKQFEILRLLNEPFPFIKSIEEWGK